MRILTSVLTISVLVPLTSVTAQEQPQIELGSRVRVSTAPTSTNPERAVGTLTALDGENIGVQASAIEPMLIPLEDITRFEVSRGQKSHWLTGLGIGFVAGGGIGAVVGYVTDEEGNDLPPAGAAAIVGGAGAAVGGLVGALIGASTKADRWEEIRLDRLRVSLGPQRDGRFGIGLSLKF